MKQPRTFLVAVNPPGPRWILGLQGLLVETCPPVPEDFHISRRLPAPQRTAAEEGQLQPASNGRNREEDGRFAIEEAKIQKEIVQRVSLQAVNSV